MCGPNQTSRTSAKEAFARVGETSAHAAAAKGGKPRTAARARVGESRCSAERLCAVCGHVRVKVQGWKLFPVQDRD